MAIITPETVPLTMPDPMALWGSPLPPGMRVPSAMGNLQGLSYANPYVQNALAGQANLFSRPLPPGTPISLAPSAGSQSALDFLSSVPKSSGGTMFRAPLTTPTLASAFPESGLAAKATGLWGSIPGGAWTRGLARGAVAGVVGQGLQSGGKALLGDTAPDPTNVGQAFSRGFSGGVMAGGSFGLPGAIVGGLGAGLGNVGGYLATGGEGHLGNIPYIGGMFGGGSKGQNPNEEFKKLYQVDPANLTAEALTAKLDSYKFNPDQRAQLRDAFNQRAADLRSMDKSNDEAMATAYKEFFLGDDKTNPKAIDFRDGKITLGNQAAGADSAALQKIMAYQQIMSQVAPHLFSPQTQDMTLYNTLMDKVTPNLAPELQPWVLKDQADTNAMAKAQNAAQAGWFQSYPSFLAQQALQSDQAQAAEQEARLKLAVLSGGNNSANLDNLVGQ